MQAEAGEEFEGQRNDLDVQVGVRRAEGLHSQLKVLAVAAVLGILVAERGRDVPRLPGRDGVVLHVGAHDRCRALGPQRHDLPVAVGEGVHLLADDVAPLPDAPVEDAHVLEDRGDGQPVAGPFDRARRIGPPGLPSGSTRATGCRACPWACGPAARRVPGASEPAAHLLPPTIRPSCRGADDRRRRPRRGA